MSRSEHTPGPWYTTPKTSRLCKGLIPIGVTGETLLLAETRHGNGEANALLAAAAPELLEVLEDIAADPGLDLYIVNKALDVIAKARGQEVAQ